MTVDIPPYNVTIFKTVVGKFLRQGALSNAAGCSVSPGLSEETGNVIIVVM